jgi:large subunit ribosomal protein L31e
MTLEREYIVPLREEWLKVAKHKRANKAMKALKQFLVKHMKIYDRDLRKIKVDQVLNNEMRFRGMKKPLSRVKVKAQKFDDDTVRVYLVDVPDHVKFARIREEKIKEKIEKKVKEDKKTEEKVEKKTETAEEKADAHEKEETSKDETMKIAKEQAKEQKHVSKIENPKTREAAHKKVQRGR